MCNVAKNLEIIRENIDKNARKSGRSGKDITLVAVSKTVDIDRMKEAEQAGVTIFGENRAQEIVKKVNFFTNSAQFHMIGRLQKNKVKYIINNTTLVHSLCSLDIAQEMQRLLTLHDLGSMDCLLQVNYAKEESKAGLTVEELPAFIEQLAELDRIQVKGLMTIAPAACDDSGLRVIFSGMYNLFENLKGKQYKGFSMEYLSMGMSGDYEIAIQEGANMVRVGSALFGERV